MNNNKTPNLINSCKNYISSEILIIIFVSILVITFKPVFVEIFSAGGSADFHLYPSRCVFQGINHYESYLNNDGKCMYFLTQWGEYAQGFYIILFPFTLLDWNTAKLFWLILNIILIFLITYFLCIKFKISKNYTYILLFLIYSGIVTKSTLIMGQQAIFVLFFLSLPFIFKSKLVYFLSGIAYFKYSIGYALFLFYLISKKYKILIISLFPCVLGWVIYCFVTNSNLLDNLFQPIQLTLKNSSTIEQFFLFSFTKFFFQSNSVSYYFLTFALIFSFNIFVISKISKLNNNLQKLTCLCILVLISIPHYPHDYIIILPLLIYSIYCYTLKLSKFLSRINLIGGIYFLNFYRATEIYMGKVLSYLGLNIEIIETISTLLPYINILGLTFILFLNLKVIKNN